MADEPTFIEVDSLRADTSTGTDAQVETQHTVVLMQANGLALKLSPPTALRRRYPGALTVKAELIYSIAGLRITNLVSQNTNANKHGCVMAQVEIQAGPHRVVSLISTEAVDALGLEPGVPAVASIKSTNVIVERAT